MKQGSTNLIELVFNKDGKTFLRVHRVIWDLIRKSDHDPTTADADDSHVSLEWTGKFEENVTIPVGWVDWECTSGPPANPQQGSQE